MMGLLSDAAIAMAPRWRLTRPRDCCGAATTATALALALELALELEEQKKQMLGMASRTLRACHRRAGHR